MLLLDKLAEQQIERHLEQTDCSENSYLGQALDLSVDAHVPAQVRALYRVLKHNGYVPAEIALRDEIQSLTQLLSCVTTNDQQRGQAAKRLQLLQLQLESNGQSRSRKSLLESAEYQSQLLEKLHSTENTTEEKP